MTKERLEVLEKNFHGKNIAIIGDLMLDGYFWGDVSRISPEAPVPVVEVDNEFFRFGGAANCALNIQKLGGVPIPVGIIGNDSDGKIFNDLMEDVNIDQSGIFFEPNRPTTTKTRVIAGTQHVVRIDKESKEYISTDLEQRISEFIKKEIKTLDAIILQDYNKGVLTENLISTIIDIANENDKIISVDPKFTNFKAYKDVTIFKPNKKETEDVLGIRITTDEDVSLAGETLLKELNAKYVLLTLGEKGIALFENGKIEIKIPTKARKVADVSGAGDTVISTITHALAAGASIKEAAFIANYAGGLVCEEVGIVPIDLNNLFSTLKENV